MRERPILFSAPMVRAILAGTKTQTRRLVQVPRRGAFVLADHGDGWRPFASDDGESIVCDDGNERPMACPYGQPGDRLYVRENFAPVDGHGHKCAPRDAAFVVLPDGAQQYRNGTYSPPLPEYQQSAFDGIKWRPSIHMPRWASRITLEVTAVRVERLQDISEEDAKAEGVTPMLGAPEPVPPAYRDGFRQLWDEINGERASWASNPFVWVVSFRRAPAGGGDHD